jgi:WW domain-binding protein 2
MEGNGIEFGAGRGGGALTAVNLTNVHLDDLPAYEEYGQSISSAQQTSNTILQPTPLRPEASQPSTSTSAATQRDCGVALPSEYNAQNKPSSEAPSDQSFDPPTGPPPGYEEAQQQSVASELERRLRQG